MRCWHSGKKPFIMFPECLSRRVLSFCVDPEGKEPNMSLDKALDKERIGSVRYPRLHLDLYAEDQDAEVKRLLKIGATRHVQTYDPEDDFVVLEDPDGNLFCVIQV